MIYVLTVTRINSPQHLISFCNPARERRRSSCRRFFHPAIRLCLPPERERFPGPRWIFAQQSSIKPPIVAVTGDPMCSSAAASFLPPFGKNSCSRKDGTLTGGWCRLDRWESPSKRPRENWRPRSNPVEWIRGWESEIPADTPINHWFIMLDLQSGTPMTT